MIADPGQFSLSSPLEREARRLCQAAGENPDEPRWRAYLEGAKARIEAVGRALLSPEGEE